MSSYTIVLDEAGSEALEERAKTEGYDSPEELLTKLAYEIYVDDRTDEEVAQCAAMLQERIDRMEAGGGTDAKEAMQTIAEKLGLKDPT